MIRKCCRRLCHPSLHRRSFAAAATTFGLLVDIDGVLIRGPKTIPGTVEGFRRISDGNGNLTKPVVFLTNGSYRSEEKKAQQLSEKLGVNLTGEQIVLVNTPLRMFKEWHDKSVFFAGQGSNLADCARDLGFHHPITISDIERDLPMFNVISHRKRLALTSGVLPTSLPPYLPIEGIIIANTPVDWDAHVQFLLDLLLTGGGLRSTSDAKNSPQLPLIGCNPDLVWASEYHLPRLACGAFIHMLASLYKEMSGRDLEVTWCGKPTPLTYTYAIDLLRSSALRLGYPGGLSEVYGIGDNVDVDVVGANENGALSVLVCSGLYRNERIDLAERVTVRSKRASVENPITARYAASNIGRFIEFLMEREER